MTFDELMVQVKTILPTAWMEFDGYGEIIIMTNLTCKDDDGNLVQVREVAGTSGTGQRQEGVHHG